jgi:hypothetical protein
MVKILIFIFVLAGTSSCGTGAPGPVVYTRAGGGRAVASAGGHRIYTSQLEEACRESGLQPRPALEKMIDEYILVHEAVEKGFLDEETVVRQWKKALIQRLLEEQVEKKIPEESVTFEDIKAYYVRSYANKGKLLEEAWQEIRFKILTERRSAAYENLVRSVEEKNKPVIHTDRIESLK